MKRVGPTSAASLAKRSPVISRDVGSRPKIITPIILITTASVFLVHEVANGAETDQPETGKASSPIRRARGTLSSRVFSRKWNKREKNAEQRGERSESEGEIDSKYACTLTT